jgi:hypothetical protein
MILAPSLKHIWDKHKTELLKLYAVEQSPRIELKNLEKRLVDSNGIQYYGFPKSFPVPILRAGRASEYLQWLSSGLSGEELDMLINQADITLTEGLKHGNGAAKLGLILEKIRERRKMVIHHELQINFLSCLLIRQDEDPAIFNEQIHKEKVTQFLDELEKGNFHFFFHLPELQNTLQLYRFTESEWIQFYEESKLQMKVMSEMVKMISLENKSSVKGKNSKKVS